MTSPRNTTRHREAAAASRAETRRRLLLAAGEEFAANGYHGATVTRIASRAGVTVQTLYLAWGSKRELLRGQLVAALAGDPDTNYADRIAGLIDEAAGQDGVRAQVVIEQVTRVYCELAARAAPSWQLYRDAAATDAEIAAEWQTLQRLRHDTFTRAVSHLPPASLRPGLNAETAADTAWAIASPETYELLVGTLGYTMAQYRAWVGTTLSAALLTTA